MMKALQSPRRSSMTASTPSKSLHGNPNKSKNNTTKSSKSSRKRNSSINNKSLGNGDQLSAMDSTEITSVCSSQRGFGQGSSQANNSHNSQSDSWEFDMDVFNQLSSHHEEIQGQTDSQDAEDQDHHSDDSSSSNSSSNSSMMDELMEDASEAMNSIMMRTQRHVPTVQQMDDVSLGAFADPVVIREVAAPSSPRRRKPVQRTSSSPMLLSPTPSSSSPRRASLTYSPSKASRGLVRTASFKPLLDEKRKLQDAKRAAKQKKLQEQLLQQTTKQPEQEPSRRTVGRSGSFKKLMIGRTSSFKKLLIGSNGKEADESTAHTRFSGNCSITDESKKSKKSSSSKKASSSSKKKTKDAAKKKSKAQRRASTD